MKFSEIMQAADLGHSYDEIRYKCRYLAAFETDSSHAHQRNSRTAIALNSRQPLTKRVPRASPAPLASVDATFLQIGDVLVSLYILNNNDRQYTRDDQHTDNSTQ